MELITFHHCLKTTRGQQLNAFRQCDEDLMSVFKDHISVFNLSFSTFTLITLHKANHFCSYWF